jgi:SET domain-containing protein
VPLLENIRVYRSPIHGYGVVARRDIQPDEVIAEVEGVMYRADQLGVDTYCLWVDDDTYFDMVDQTRWINHSCDPNAEVDADVDEHGQAWARIVAIRPIKAGEEISYHYGFSYNLAEPCRCGARGCIGWIVDPDEIPALAERLAREKREAAAAALSVAAVDVGLLAAPANNTAPGLTRTRRA